MELLQFLADEVQSKRSKCNATTQRLNTKNTKVEELDLKAWLLIDKAGKVGMMQQQLDIRQKS